jgi:hypothetical protein
VHKVIGIAYCFGCYLCLKQESRGKPLLLEKQVAAVKDQSRQFEVFPYFFKLIGFFGQTAQLTA